MGDVWPLTARRDASAVIDDLLSSADPGIGVITGPAGVGRSRVADEARRAARRARLRTVRALGTRAASRIPLGAFVGVLGDLGSGPGLLAQARALLLGGPDDPPLLLVVDDAHLLDDVSATLVLSLADQPSVRLLATVPTGSSPPDAITALWKDLGAHHLELAPLDVDEVAELLEAVLEGPVSTQTADTLHEASGGLLLNLRELVESARRDGQLDRIEGVWRLRGRPLPGRRLADLIALRLADLPAPALRAVQVLALAQPLPTSLVEATCGPDALPALEEQGIVEVSRYDATRPLDGGEPGHDLTEVIGLGGATLYEARPDDVQLSNPLYGEVALMTATAAEHSELLDACADALEATAAQAEDLLRVALWRLRSGNATDAPKLLEAAHHAYRLADYPRVRELAEAAWRLQPSGDAGHLLGFTLGRAGECEEAEAVLAKSSDLVDDDRMRTFVALARAENLQRGLGDVAAAIEVCRNAEASLDDDAWRDEVRAHRAMIVLQVGDLEQAHLLLDPIIDQGPDAARRAFVKAAYAQELALVHDGRFDDAMALSRRALPVHEAVWEADVFQTEPAVHHLSTLIALTMSGRLLEADLMGQIALDLTRRGNPRYGFAWMSYLVGMNDLLLGRVDTARRHLLDAVPIFREGRQEMVARWCLAGAATCSALLGDASGAASQLHGADRLEHPRVRMNHGQVADAAGWVAYSRGELDRARAHFDAEADAALAEGDRMNALRLLHSLVRCGGAESALDRLDATAAVVDGSLAAALAAFAHAVVDHDAEACTASADRFEEMGSALLAAEASAEAARAFARQGDRRKATAADHRRAALLQRCEGASTPLTWPASAVSPLSRREREIAGLAASGLASKEIAERLTISRRTVDNHLQRVFKKLGVTSRTELAAALEPGLDSAVG